MQPDDGGMGAGQNMRLGDIVLDDAKLGMAAKGVFALLNLLGNESNVGELAGRTSDDEESVRAALAQLEAAGYVRVEGDSVKVQRHSSFGVTF